MFELRRLKNTDFWLVTLMVILSIIGAMNIFATTFFPDKKPNSLFFSQIIFYLIGFAIFFVISIFDIRILKKRFILILVYLFTITSLALVLFGGTTRFGAQRWISFGNFDFQPSETTKIALIILVSFVLTQFKMNTPAKTKELVVQKNKYKKKIKISFIQKNKFLNYIYRKCSHLLNRFETRINKNLNEINFKKYVYSVLILGTFGFLIERQNSLGNLVLLILIYLALVFASIILNSKAISYIIIFLLLINLSFELITLNEKYVLTADFQNSFFRIDFLFLILGLAISLYLIWRFKLNIILILSLCVLILPSKFVLEYTYNNILEQYQRNRIESFLNPEKDPALSWNRKQSIIAVGSGRFVGKGFLKGTQTNYRFLPFSFTDFAFAAIAEQFGFRGMLILSAIYFLFFMRIYKIAKNSKDKFSYLITYGVMCMMFFNFFQHAGMNIGILPITGVPLPLISYGGSYLISTFIGLGLVMAVNNNMELRKTKVYRVKSRR